MTFQDVVRNSWRWRSGHCADSCTARRTTRTIRSDGDRSGRCHLLRFVAYVPVRPQAAQEMLVYEKMAMQMLVWMGQGGRLQPDWCSIVFGWDINDYVGAPAPKVVQQENH
eukprot:8341942-Pyramimonas_sp.AAC.1